MCARRQQATERWRGGRGSPKGPPVARGGFPLLPPSFCRPDERGATWNGEGGGVDGVAPKAFGGGGGNVG